MEIMTDDTKDKPGKKKQIWGDLLVFRNLDLLPYYTSGFE